MILKYHYANIKFKKKHKFIHKFNFVWFWKYTLTATGLVYYYFAVSLQEKKVVIIKECGSSSPMLVSLQSRWDNLKKSLQIIMQIIASLSSFWLIMQIKIHLIQLTQLPINTWVTSRVSLILNTYNKDKPKTFCMSCL